MQRRLLQQERRRSAQHRDAGPARLAKTCIVIITNTAHEWSRMRRHTSLEQTAMSTSFCEQENGLRKTDDSDCATDAASTFSNINISNNSNNNISHVSSSIHDDVNDSNISRRRAAKGSGVCCVRCRVCSAHGER